jgi:monoamine oxidase
MGGFTQTVGFDPGLYINPGPWRIPYHHRALLDYCRRLGVPLQPFIELNGNSFLHNSNAFGGKPQRFRHISADFNGYVAELLAKVADQDKLDETVTKEDREILLHALKSWGSLDENYRYTSATDSAMRGYNKDPNGGPDGAPVPSTPISRDDILRSGLWQYINFPLTYEYEQTLFQPIGGMDMIAQAFARAVGEVGALITYNAKVTDITQRAVEYGAQIHPQYNEEFDTGVAVAWHRVPWTLGCYGMWKSDTRRDHYKNLCAIDGRTVLAGEHCSYVNAWQEGAILSALSAITRLHARVVA